jgi:hypothetical protein
MKKIIAVCFVVFALACTDTEKESWRAYGNPAAVKCYSGGIIIFDGRSTGRVETVHNSDGWEFKDAATGSFTRVSGDCVVIHTR